MTVGRQLTDAHRIAQNRLGAQTVARLHPIWPLLDPTDLDGTFPRWLLAATPIVQAQRAISSRLAASYLAAFKRLHSPNRVDAVLADPIDVPTLTTSLLVTGPISVKRAMHRGVPLERAMSTAEAASAAAAMRHVINGSRDTIIQTVRRDPDAGGFQRVASGNACEFCADLAGARFRDDEVFQAHDGCSCTAEPVYR